MEVVDTAMWSRSTIFAALSRITSKDRLAECPQSLSGTKSQKHTWFETNQRQGLCHDCVVHNDDVNLRLLAGFRTQSMRPVEVSKRGKANRRFFCHNPTSKWYTDGARKVIQPNLDLVVVEFWSRNR